MSIHKLDIFLNFWSLTSFCLNMDNTSLFSHHCPFNPISHFGLHSSLMVLIIVLDQVALVSFSGTQINFELKLQSLAFPSAIFSVIVLSLSFSPWALIQLPLELFSVSVCFSMDSFVIGNSATAFIFPLNLIISGISHFIIVTSTFCFLNDLPFHNYLQ